jgi:hypothetical protein
MRKRLAVMALATLASAVWLAVGAQARPGRAVHVLDLDQAKAALVQLLATQSSGAQITATCWRTGDHSVRCRWAKLRVYSDSAASVCAGGARVMLSGRRLNVRTTHARCAT